MIEFHFEKLPEMSWAYTIKTRIPRGRVVALARDVPSRFLAPLCSFGKNANLQKTRPRKTGRGLRPAPRLQGLKNAQTGPAARMTVL